MNIQNFTTFNDIRAALGTNDIELADATLSLGLYQDALVADLEDVHIDLPAKYQEVVAVDEADRTAGQERFLTAARVFATYAVARHLTVSLPIFSPVRIDDGKGSMQRVNDPHYETVKAVHREYDRWRKRLLEAFIGLGQAAEDEVARPYLSVVRPADDPVTG